MLQQLHILNYAIIEEIEINFSEGLNIITGETGAGKSILMGALSLILGERADTSVLMDKNKKCFIEGTFSKGLPQVKEFLLHNDLDAEEDIVIRREIAPNGKSRAFVNDTPVNLGILKGLTSLLVDLHQQFDTLELGDNDFQRQVIDALANHSADIQQYQAFYRKYQSLLRDLDELQSEQSDANKEFDYNMFLLEELREAGFSANELEESESLLKVMSNAENIKGTLNGVYAELQESEQPVVQQVKLLYNQLNGLSAFHATIPQLVERLHATQVELQDIADEVNRLNDTVNYDTEKINELNERLALGYRLLKKHGVQSTTALLDVMHDLELRVNKVTNLAGRISEKEQEVRTAVHEAEELAAKISSARQKQLHPFEGKVNKLLTQVGMPNAKIKVQASKVALNEYGQDAIEFLFDANLPAGSKDNNTRYEPLRKVASGGELSRLMLSIKSLVARSVQLPTLIFDEIDTGISGEAARQVGIIMKGLSTAHQVIAITHQPQIAAKAAAHYFVYKEIKGNRIGTAIRLLDHDERISVIATMLSGEKPTPAAFENAKEMIDN